jgi:DNA polymerase-3 subunit epsilon
VEKKRILYAVTDIETTGGYASGNGITEIAVILTDGIEIIDEFQSLVNPGVPIPPYISTLTGITDEMVRRAPSFDDIADELEDFLAQGIFVAHNVNFDYSFVRESFASCGIDWKPQRMCTVRLSKKAFPGMRSYGLENLCREMEIFNQAAHRAYGDARATVEVLHRCLRVLDDKDVNRFVLKNTPEVFLPNHISLESFNALPQVTGIYFFLDQQMKPIYVGKAKNIRKRVQQHFSRELETPKQQAFMKDIHHFDHLLTGSELIALLVEDQEIRKSWPKFNRAQKRKARKVSVMAYTDQNGYDRLAVYENEAKQGCIRFFNSKQSAEQWLVELAEIGELNRKLLGLPFGDLNMSLPAPSDHNQALRNAIEKMEERETTYVIICQGRTKEEYGFVCSNMGDHIGYGFVPIDNPLTEPCDLEMYMTRITPSETSHGIVRSYIEKPRGMRVITFQGKSIMQS